MVVTMCYLFKDKKETSMTFGPSFSTPKSTDLWFIVQYIDVLSDCFAPVTPVNKQTSRAPFYLLSYIFVL